jgi:hypothetical protein
MMRKAGCASLSRPTVLEHSLMDRMIGGIMDINR